MSTQALERILRTKLKANANRVRVSADSYHVATVSSGMNDPEEYAQLFSAAPDMLTALRALTVLETREDGAIVIGPRGWEMAQEARKKAEGKTLESEAANG